MSYVSDAFLAAERGAASVYHAILATGAHISTWEATDPMVGVLIHAGLSYAQAALVRYGVPAATVSLASEDITAALRGLAALDATLPSVTLVKTEVISQTPIAKAAPDAADEVIAAVAAAVAGAHS
jgi:hypothetical protein